MKKLLNVILLGFALLPRLGGAESAGVTVRANPREFRAGGSTQVSITLSGEPREGIDLPKIKDAEWRTDRVGRSSRVNIVNGKSSRSETYTLPLSVSRPGEFTIPPFEVRFADGTTGRSEPLALKVRAPGEAPPPPPGVETAIVLPAGRGVFYVGEEIPVEFVLTLPERLAARLEVGR